MSKMMKGVRGEYNKGYMASPRMASPRMASLRMASKGLAAEEEEEDLRMASNGLGVKRVRGESPTDFSF